ncbi:MAG TPA: hypothetical protein VJY15_21670 [Candidatus Acidoferrum sp.]|nr:hypothetical protein [Candidatus Acidoferrum sp.]
MSIFGGQSDAKTEMGTQVGQSDFSLKTNYHGSATLDTSITSASWLPGTTGVDCKLVDGDRWQKITGKMTQDVDGDKTSTYGGAFTETYTGDVKRTMHGVVEENYWGAGGNTRDYYTHLDEHFWLGHKQQNEVEEIEIRKYKMEIIDIFSFECNPMKFEILGLGVTVEVAGEVSVSPGLQLEAGTFGMDFHGVALESALKKSEYGILKDEAKALESKIAALEFEVGELDVDNRAFSLVEMVLGQGFLAP